MKDEVIRVYVWNVYMYIYVYMYGIDKFKSFSNVRGNGHKKKLF